MGIDNPVHLIFIAAVALIVLGPKRLPELARSLGHGMREFRESMSEAVTGSLVPEQAHSCRSESMPTPRMPWSSIRPPVSAVTTSRSSSPCRLLLS